MPKITVTIEEHISQDFEVEAETIEEAMQIAEEKYYDGQFVVNLFNEPDAVLMKAYVGNGDYAEWKNI